MASVSPDNNSRTKFKTTSVHPGINVRPTGNGPDRKSLPLWGGFPSDARWGPSGQEMGLGIFRPGATS
jgi:hypothetical protein